MVVTILTLGVLDCGSCLMDYGIYNTWIKRFDSGRAGCAKTADAAYTMFGISNVIYRINYFILPILL